MSCQVIYYTQSFVKTHNRDAISPFLYSTSIICSQEAKCRLNQNNADDVSLSGRCCYSMIIGIGLHAMHYAYSYSTNNVCMFLPPYPLLPMCNATNATTLEEERGRMAREKVLLTEEANINHHPNILSGSIYSSYGPEASNLGIQRVRRRGTTKNTKEARTQGHKLNEPSPTKRMRTDCCCWSTFCPHVVDTCLDAHTTFSILTWDCLFLTNQRLLCNEYRR